MNNANKKTKPARNEYTAEEQAWVDEIKRELAANDKRAADFQMKLDMGIIARVKTRR